jgi:hypothetical protein
MSGAGTTAEQTLNAAVTPTRSLLFYTLTSTAPLAVVVAWLLFGRPNKTVFLSLSVIGLIVSVVGLGRLLYELTYDIAGYPEFKLPIWAVFYLIIYLVSGFAFIFFGIHVGVPGRYFTGLETEPKAAFLDSLYLSLSNYIGMSPDSSISARGQLPRFLSVTEGVLAMFVNVVIITKFVNSF